LFIGLLALPLSGSLNDGCHAMSDKSIENPAADRTENKINYRARLLGASGLVECLLKDASCHWKIPFGEGWLCAHMFNKRIAKGLRVDGCTLASVDECSENIRQES
jgi:hypothetical protein